jgi:hypothetical protein
LGCAVPLSLETLKYPVASKSSTSYAEARARQTATGGSATWSKGASSFLLFRAAEEHAAPMKKEVRTVVGDQVLHEAKAAVVYMMFLPR